jgi:hypothetical protein
MANGSACRTTNRTLIGAALLAVMLLLPPVANAELSADDDSYFYPTIGKFDRTDSGAGFTVEESGENYGVGVFFRTPVSTSMQGSPNVEAATETDRRFVANFRVELNFIKAELTASADNAVAYDSTSYSAIGTPTAVGESKYRVFHGDGDVGYRIKMSNASALEPFLGLGIVYMTRDVDGRGFAGHGTLSKLVNARTGVRGELDLGGEMSLFGELGVRFPLYTQIKENLAPSITFKPGMGLSDSETIGFRYAQFRIFLFREKMAFKSSSGGEGLTRPESKEETVGLRFGIGY